MGQSCSSFHRSFEARHHLDTQSFGSRGCSAECVWSTDVTSIPLLEQWRRAAVVQQNKDIEGGCHFELIDKLL